MKSHNLRVLKAALLLLSSLIGCTPFVDALLAEAISDSVPFVWLGVMCLLMIAIPSMSSQVSPSLAHSTSYDVVPHSSRVVTFRDLLPACLAVLLFILMLKPIFVDIGILERLVIITI